MSAIEPIEKAALAAHLADEKKAEKVTLLDVRGLCNFADFFVICTANNRVQLNAINDNIADGLRRRGMKYPVEAAEAGASWLVLDAGDLVAHIMTQEARDFYRLERLWGDAKEVDWQRIIDRKPALAADPKG